MVKNTRKKARSDTFRAINKPIPVSVMCNRQGLPKSIKLNGRWINVLSIEDRWRIDDEWWRDQPINRMYFSCNLYGEVIITFYHDLTNQLWYLQRI